MAPKAALDAGAIVGLLADEDRRGVFAAVALGAGTAEAVASASALTGDRTRRALARLVHGGLVVPGDGGLAIDGDAFHRAARAARARPRSDEHDAEPLERRRVLTAFVHDGRITSLPSARAKRQVVLDWLAQSFEPGVRYSEQQVNDIIAARHPDTAALRRYLVDEDLLDRAAGEYWRTGGSVM